MKRALVSVTNKSNLIDLKLLHETGLWEFVSTGGTLTELEKIGIPCIHIEKVTGFPEMMSGRLKILHPKVFGGILANRDNPNHMKDLRDNNITEIDLVIVNLYDFHGKPDIENVDVGGPSALCAAGKNGNHVSAVVDPADYKRVVAELIEKGELTIELREDLTIKAFETVSQFYGEVSTWMKGERESGHDFLTPKKLAGGAH